MWRGYSFILLPSNLCLARVVMKKIERKTADAFAARHDGVTLHCKTIATTNG
jgi:hypothetical protein